MKKSIIFLIVFFLISMVGAVVTNFILGIKYERLDWSDSYLGRKKIELPPFKYVKFYGNDKGVEGSVFVQPGNDFAFLTRIDTNDIGWYVKSDTLFFEFKSVSEKGWDVARPNVYLVAPHIAGVNVSRGYCKVRGWNIPSLDIQIGEGVWRREQVILAENMIDSLFVRVNYDGILKIEDDNKIRNKSILKIR